MSSNLAQVSMKPHDENCNISNVINEKTKDQKINQQQINKPRPFGNEVTNLNIPHVMKTQKSFNIQNLPNVTNPNNAISRSHSLNAPKNTDNQKPKSESNLETSNPLDEASIQSTGPFFKLKPVVIEKKSINADEQPEAEISKPNISNNPREIGEYIHDIMKYLRETEAKYLPKSGYMSIQTDINEKMRAILVDWLVDVHAKFKLRQETLFLAINVLDRYLGIAQVTRQKLQLVGVTALFIASKYEEIYPPEINDFIYATDKACKKEDILEVEGKILLALNFNLNPTSSNRFLEGYINVLGFDEKVAVLAKYLLELTLVDYKMLKYTQSNIAASSLYLSCKIFRIQQWNDITIQTTNYTEAQAKSCAKDLYILLQNASKSNLQAVRKKYGSSKFLQISKMLVEKFSNNLQ